MSKASGGAKQVVWGSGSDRVEQIVGLTYWETFGADDSLTLVGRTTVRGQPAIVYQMRSTSDGWDLGFSWAEEDYDRTVFLAPGTTQAIGGIASLARTAADTTAPLGFMSLSWTINASLAGYAAVSVSLIPAYHANESGLPSAPWSPSGGALPRAFRAQRENPGVAAMCEESSLQGRPLLMTHCLRDQSRPNIRMARSQGRCVHRRYFSRLRRVSSRARVSSAAPRDGRARRRRSSSRTASTAAGGSSIPRRRSRTASSASFAGIDGAPQWRQR